MGLINIPTAYNRQSAQLETGLFYQYGVQSASLQLKNFFLSYSFSDYTEYALMIYNQSVIGHHVQQRLWKGSFSQESSDAIAFGVKDFGVTGNALIIPSIYFILSGQVFSNEYFEYNAGVNLLNPFNLSSFSTQFFGGVQTFLNPARIMMEFDGQNWNAGMQFEFPPKVALSVAINKLLSTTVQNEFVVGLSYRYNLFGSYEDRQKTLEEQYKTNEARLDDLKQLITQLPEPGMPSGSASPYVTTVTVVVTVPVEVTPEIFMKRASLTSADIEVDLPEILAMLQQGLEAYYRGDLEGALEKYLMVLSIDPNIVVAQVRIGSIYYRLGNKLRAQEYWRRAYELDPYNEELQRFLKALPKAAPP